MREPERLWKVYCVATAFLFASGSKVVVAAASQTQVGKSGHGTPRLAFSSTMSPEAVALQKVMAGSGASAIVLNAADGRVLATAGDVHGPRYAPGSTLKPFVLLRALGDGIVRPATVLPCRGTLMVGGRNVACTHPRELRSFTAETALAYSCNEYFAAIAARMQPQELEQALGAYGVRSGISTAALQSPNARVLLALGLAGVRVTVAQIAEAYKRLVSDMAGSAIQSQRASLELVQRGLEGSVKFGMAYGAATDGVRLAGKTGTASEPGQAWTHGWFAGIVYSTDGKPEQVVVMLVPHGSGGDAALLAHRLLVLERER